jgi:hypothetical protein
MHVARQRYLVTPTATKRVKSEKKIETIIIKILNKNIFKNKNSPPSCATS